AVFWALPARTDSGLFQSGKLLQNKHVAGRDLYADTSLAEQKGTIECESPRCGLYCLSPPPPASCLRQPTNAGLMQSLSTWKMPSFLSASRKRANWERTRRAASRPVEWRCCCG